MNRELTTPALIASVVSIAITGRRLIDSIDRASFRDVGETLDALHEHLGVAGGALLFLALRLDCEAEVERMLKEGLGRGTAFRGRMCKSFTRM